MSDYQPVMLDAIDGVENLPMEPGRVAAVMVGAGFSKALNPHSPLWRDLVFGVRKNLFPAEPEPSPKDQIDLLVETFRLSWRFSRMRDARSTRFQEEVRSYLSKAWANLPQSANGYEKRRKELAETFCKFIRLSSCRIILDLNYDPSVEQVLDEAGIRYVRWIGSEASWTGPLPGDAVVLWKIHGSLNFPATIVLSPTEYQRLYEINAIGSALANLGNSIDAVWSIGVGLQDDDVWAYLCSASRPFPVVALWMTSPSAMSSDVSGWHSAVSTVRSGEPRRVTILRENLNGGEHQLATAVGRVVAAIDARWQERRRGRAKRDIPSGHAEKSAAEFDEVFQKAVEGRRDLHGVIRQYNATYDAFLNHFLCHRKDEQFGPRWCPGITREGAIRPLDEETRKNYAADFMEVIKRAEGLVRAGEENAILIPAAAQAAVRHVVELADLLGLEVSSTFEPPATVRTVPKDTYVVGTNPFHLQDGDRSNPMHTYQLGAMIRLGPPLVGNPSADPLPDGSDGLLTEDEWESALVYLFTKSGYRVRIEGEETAISAIPPLYPWGFRFMDIRKYRTHNVGSVSKCWQLVGTSLPDGRQICKGGGLRDCLTRTFQLGSRGAVRIGEYDEFLAEAVRHRKAAS